MKWLPGGMLELALVPEPDLAGVDGHAHDLVMLGTLREGRQYWLCSLWGPIGHPNDFVHTGTPCRP